MIFDNRRDMRVANVVFRFHLCSSIGFNASIECLLMKCLMNERMNESIISVIVYRSTGTGTIPVLYHVILNIQYRGLWA